MNLFGEIIVFQYSSEEHDLNYRIAPSEEQNIKLYLRRYNL